MESGKCKAHRFVIARRPKADVAISGRHCRPVPAAEKTYRPLASVAALTAQPLAALPPYGCGVPFTGGERHGGLQYAPHCLYGARLSDLSLRGAKRRGNFAVPMWIAGRLWRNRNCLPEIAASACGLLAMTNLGADAILTPACTSRKFCAGPGCPLPYYGGCGRRSARESATANGAHRP